MELTLPGCLALENGWLMMAEVLDRRQVQVPCGEMHAYVDRDALDLPLTVRCRRPGDRFQPLGMGHTRISDFMINKKSRCVPVLPGRWCAAVGRLSGWPGYGSQNSGNKRRYRKGNSPVSSERPAFAG